MIGRFKFVVAGVTDNDSKPDTVDLRLRPVGQELVYKVRDHEEYAPLSYKELRR